MEIIAEELKTNT
ncbi:unnamed protein product, partial [Rotaria sp. Silwood1]